MKKDLITVIEITDTHVKLLQARGQREQIFFSYGDVRPISQFSDDAVAALVAEMAGGRDINSEHLLVVVPRRFSILKSVALPSHSDDEIKRMLGLQLAQHIPYSREDVVFDGQIVKKDPGGYATVLVVAVHKDVVHRYLDILHKAKLSPPRMVLSSFGILEWWNYHSLLNKRMTDEPVMVVNIDERGCEICFVYRDQLLFSRNIHFGSRDLHEEGISGFLEQIGLTIGAYRKEKHGPDLSKIVILSAVPEAARLQEQLQHDYPLPVEMATPFDDLPCEKDVDLGFLANHRGVSVTVALGFLLGHAHRQVNLIPAQVETIRRTRREKLAWIRLFIALVLTVALIVIALEAGSYHDLRYLQQLEQKIATTKATVVRAEKQIQFLEFVKANLGQRVLIADLIKVLYQAAPQEITFNSLSLDAKGTLVIQGTVSAGTSVNIFQQALMRSKLMKDVSLEYATKRRRIDGEYTEFKIVCKIRTREAEGL